MHALIIEPEPFTAQLIEDCLADLGFTSFAFAADEDEAIIHASACCPDLITADVTLASGCGLSAVQRICDSVAIAVLYVTATANDVRARCPGATIVQKPFSVVALIHGVHRARQPR